jgi:hypothetical protein
VQVSVGGRGLPCQNDTGICCAGSKEGSFVAAVWLQGALQLVKAGSWVGAALCAVLQRRLHAPLGHLLWQAGLIRSVH